MNPAVTLDGIAFVFSGSVLIWFIRTMISVRDMVRDHKMELYGNADRSGLVKKVDKLEDLVRDRTHGLNNSVQRIDSDVENLWEHMQMPKPRQAERRRDGLGEHDWSTDS